MFDWRRIFIWDVGKWHARRNYPREETFVAVPLYLPEESEAAASAPGEAPRPEVPITPANDPHEPPKESEA
jgi:hypothetical protein